MTEGKLPNRFDQLISEARDYRVKQEALWMEIDYYLDGQYYVTYDQSSRSIRILPQPLKRGVVRRSVNLLRAKVRTVSNMVTKNEPAFNIRPNYFPGMTPEEMKKARDDADAMQALCVSIWRKGNTRQKIKRLARVGLKRGLAVAQIHWSDDLDDVDLKVDDPYNWLFDPLCKGEIQKAQYIINQMVVSKKELEQSGKYDAEKLAQVKTVKRLSPSDYRDSYLQSKYASASGGDGIILYKVWEKKYIEESTKKMVTKEVDGIETEIEEETKEKKCKVTCTYVSDGIELRKETFDINFYPIYLYYPEINEGELYPRPYFADLIPLNKVVNNIMSYTEEFIATVGQGRYLKKKATKITTQSTGQHGQIIEYEGNEPPSPMSIPQIPFQVVQALLSNTERYMSEIGGAQFLDAQQVIGSNMSGKAIGQLQAQQSESIGEPTENLAQTVKDIFEGFLMLARDNYITARQIPSIKGEDERVYRIRGRNGKSASLSDEHYRDETIIDSLPEMRVEIIPGAMFSELQKKNDVIELKNMNLVDDETVLDAYKIGATAEVIERLEAEKERKLALAAKAQVQEGSLQNKLEQERKLTEQNNQLNSEMAKQEGAMALDPFMRVLQNNPPEMTPEEPQTVGA